MCPLHPVDRVNLFRIDFSSCQGHPESYFRQPDEQSWAQHWGITRPGDGGFSWADYVQSALQAGRTQNGVFAARIMCGTMTELTGQLGLLYPELAGADVALLNQVFGATRFVYLRRDDVLGQAVSWLRAEQTGVWLQSAQSARPRPTQEPDFDLDQIQRLIHLIGAHNAARQEWFESAGIEPYPVHYAELAADPAGLARDVLGFLGLDLPAGWEIRTQHDRLADELNADWIRRYQAEAG